MDVKVLVISAIDGNGERKWLKWVKVYYRKLWVKVK